MPTSLLRAGPLAADFVSGTNRPTFAVRNGHRVAVFPSAGTTETFYTFNMPTVFAEGDIEVKLKWMAESAIINDCVWAVAFERHQDGVDDLDSNSFAADIVASAETVPGTAGQTVETAIPVTSALYDGITQGDQFRLRVRRLGDDAGDTLADNAQLMTVVIEQAADPAGGGGGGFWTDGAGTRAGIGKGSPAPVAAGIEALAHGSGASGAGDYSLALGRYADAPADHGIALGPNTDAETYRSIAIGDDARGGHSSYPTYTECIGIGYEATSRGHRSISIGFESEVQPAATHGIAIGVYANCDSPNSIAIGTYADADDTGDVYAIAIGYRTESSGQRNTGIGYKVYSWGSDNVSIGQDIYMYSGTNNVFIGETIKTVAGRNRGISIGSFIYSGSEDIIIGHQHCSGNDQDGDYNNNNILIKTDDDPYSGLSNGGNPTPGSLWENIVFVTGSRGGCRTWNGNNQSRNIIINPAGGSYTYGDCNNEIVIGSEIEVGDFNNQTDHHEHNIHIGYRGSTAWYPGGDTEHNVAIGSSCYIGTYAYRNVCIGANSGVFTENASNWTSGNVAIGYDAYIGSGQGNVCVGARSRVYAFGTLYYGYGGSDYFRGNVALGFGCEIEPPSTDRWTASLAHGCGARPWLGGHRTFSDNVEHQSHVNPNQGGFVVPKVETDDNVQTTIMTFPTQADKAYLVYGHLISRRTDADGKNAAFSVATQLVYRNAAGGPTLVGDPVSWTMDKNQGSPTWTVDMSISGNNLLVRVTGATGETVEWLGVIWVLEIRG